MKQICVISPSCSKESATNLAKALSCNYHKAEFKDLSMYDCVINYGSSNPFLYKHIINSPESVAISVNKLSTLKRISDFCSTIDWSKDKEKARLWLKKDGIVIIRNLATSSQGKGLVYCEDEKTLEKETNAKFYTRYFEHTHEVRVNVFKDKIIGVYKKIQKEDTFFFHHVVKPSSHPEVEKMIKVIRNKIGIDLFGMDILVNKKAEVKLLEINSGMILQDETKEELVKLLKKELK